MSLAYVVCSTDDGLLHRSVFVEEDVRVVVAMGKDGQRLEDLCVVPHEIFDKLLWDDDAQNVE